jgi:C-terminal processing protease CtpA/Prc
MRSFVASVVFVLLLASAASSQTQPAAAPGFNVALANKAVHDLYDHLGEVYPCFELKKIDWKKVGDELLPQADKIQTETDFGLLCLRMVARLQDSHAQLLSFNARPPAPDLPLYDPGFACLIDDRDRPVVYYLDPNGPAAEAGLKIGMTITAVHGQVSEKAIDQWMKEISDFYGYSSERYLRYEAARGFMRVREKGQMVKVEAEDLHGQPLQFVIPATMGIRYLPRLPVPIEGINDSGSVECKDLGNGIGYIYVRRIGDKLPEELDAALSKLGHSDALILDVRGNSGGGFDPNEAFRAFDQQHYGGPIALLLDERCISAGEGWASWFIANKRARTFGATTAGASSRKEEYELSNHLYKVRIPVKAYTGSLDRPIESKGLEPDVPVRSNAKDLSEGRDTVLEKAKNSFDIKKMAPPLRYHRRTTQKS